MSLISCHHQKVRLAWAACVLSWALKRRTLGTKVFFFGRKIFRKKQLPKSWQKPRQNLVDWHQCFVMRRSFPRTWLNLVLQRSFVNRNQFLVGLNHEQSASQKISFLTKILPIPETSQKLQTLPQYSFRYDVLRSFSGMQGQTVVNISFKNNYSILRRQSVSDRNIILQCQVMGMFSPTNKQRVIKCIQRQLQYPALVRSCKRQAGVLIPLCVVDGNPSVLFTVRSPDLFTNRGDVRLVFFVSKWKSKIYTVCRFKHELEFNKKVIRHSILLDSDFIYKLLNTVCQGF